MRFLLAIKCIFACYQMCFCLLSNVCLLAIKFLESFLFIPFHSLPTLFLKDFRQNPCTFQSYYLSLPSLKFSCGAFHINKGRGYMFKPDQLFLMLWAYFFAHTSAASSRGTCALCLCGAFHIVWRCRQTEYGGSPSTCFFSPLWWIT